MFMNDYAVAAAALSMKAASVRSRGESPLTKWLLSVISTCRCATSLQNAILRAAHFIINIKPLRMMIHRLSFERDSRHEGESSIEIGKLETFFDRIATLGLRPAGGKQRHEQLVALRLA